MKDWRGATLLGVQIICMLYIVLSGFLFASPVWIWLELIGIALLAWAVATMKPQHLNPLPQPRRDARLVTSGPYRWIRHPMYAAVLIIGLALVIDRPTTTRLVIWIVLLVDLIVKLHYEETLLGGRFREYASYRKRTKRLIPFVY